MGGSYLVVDTLYLVITIEIRLTITYGVCMSKVVKLAGGRSAINRATLVSYLAYFLNKSPIN